MVVGDGAESIPCSAPLLGHLVHVGRPPIAFQCLVLFARTSLIEKVIRDVLLALLEVSYSSEKLKQYGVGVTMG